MGESLESPPPRKLQGTKNHRKPEVKFLRSVKMTFAGKENESVKQLFWGLVHPPLKVFISFCSKKVRLLQMPSKVFDAKNRLVNAQFAHLQLLSPSLLHRVYFTKFLADDDQDTRTSSGQSNE